MSSSFGVQGAVSLYLTYHTIGVTMDAMSTRALPCPCISALAPVCFPRLHISRAPLPQSEWTFFPSFWLASRNVDTQSSVGSYVTRLMPHIAT